MLAVMHPDSNQSRMIRTVFKMSGITHRYSVLEDYGKTADFTVYPVNGQQHFPSTQKRIGLYRKHALPLSLESVHDLFLKHPVPISEITHLIVVSCTGMYAPGLDIDLIKTLNLPRTIDRVCINFMGCYAAFNALKTADAFCRSNPKAKVLIVCTELCSIHFQHTPTEDNILANALFGDGAAAMLVENSGDADKKLVIENFYNDLFLAGEKDMAWSIGDEGFQMKLSSYIPELIKAEIGNLTRNLLQKINKTKEDIKYFAFHPGGKRILQAIDDELKLGQKNSWAYSVLERFGNMSSPTVVFVLKEIFESLQRPDNDEYVLSAAFGPGLTLESMLLKVELN